MERSETVKGDFSDLLNRASVIGKEVLAVYAVEVDRDARFPHEAFTALKKARMLSVYVPSEYGGAGLNIEQVAQLCEVFGRYCGSSAMIFAMHQIQVACIVHHAIQSPYFSNYVRRICAEQLLLASATTEVGVGGDLRTSLSAVRIKDNRFRVTKQAPVVSYMDAADALLLTCRRGEDATKNDQVQVLIEKNDLDLEPMRGWDTMGWRGTCSAGFTVHGSGATEQILPAPYAEIHAKTMHPVAHITWGALWTGVAVDAMSRARGVVRGQARKTPGILPISATRLAEADQILFNMRTNLADIISDYNRMLPVAPVEAYSDFSFNIRVNNLKLNISTQLVDLVGRAMLIAGIDAYRNDSEISLCRHLRDAWGTMLMVNNDRILGLNAAMQIVQKDV